MSIATASFWASWKEKNRTGKTGKNKICDKTVYYYMNKYKYTREEALAIATRVKYKDVYGRTYKTIREMAEILGVSRGGIQYRLKKGLPRG